ncbi:MAG: hypothetical protein GWO22_20810, partial [Actinobacteria bacterium]|nr:hypothetical protein [Actinomycetota bacterium]NIW29643.1 hypothetical protein [Actinomycetota bacterium]
SLQPEHLVTGRKGGFFVSAPITVAAGVPARWTVAADTGCDHGDVARMQAL